MKITSKLRNHIKLVILVLSGPGITQLESTTQPLSEYNLSTQLQLSHLKKELAADSRVKEITESLLL